MTWNNSALFQVSISQFYAKNETEVIAPPDYLCFFYFCIKHHPVKPLPLLWALLFFWALSCQQQAADEAITGPNDCKGRLQLLEKELESFDQEESSPTELAQAIEQVLECSGEEVDIKIAGACRILGLHYYHLGASDTARYYYGIGLGRKPKSDLLGRLYCNMGFTYHADQEYVESLSYFDNARLAGQHEMFSPYFFKATAYLGDAYLRLGHLHIAESYLKQALQLTDGVEESLRAPFISEACQFMSDCKRRMKKYRAAIAVGRRGVLTLDTLSKLYAEDVYTLGNIYLNLGNAWQDSMLQCTAQSKAWEESGSLAISYSLQALHLYREGGATFRENIYTTMLNLGELYRRQGKGREAFQVLSQAIVQLEGEESSKMADRILLAKLYLNRGEASMGMGQLEQAGQDFDSSLTRLVPWRNTDTPLKLPSLDGPASSPGTLMLLLGDIADLHKKRAGRRPETSLLAAMEAYDSLLVLANEVRASYIMEKDKVFLGQQARARFDSAFLLSLKLYELEGDSRYLYKAMEASEFSKSLSLVERAHSNHMKRYLGETQQQELDQLLADRNAIHERAYRAGTNREKQLEIQQEWARNIAARRSFREKQGARAPALKQQQQLLATTPLRDIQRESLDSNQAILEYFRQDSTLFAFLLTTDSLYFRKVELNRQFFEDAYLIDAILSGKKHFPTIREKEAAYCSASKRVYDKLFPDFGRQLPYRLVIIPDAPFLSLPFEALWVSEQAGGFSRLEERKHFLVYQHAASYCHSANLWYHMNVRDEEEETRRNEVAVFATRFPPELKAGRIPLPSPIQKALPTLSPLPNGREAQAISRQVSAKVYQEEAASKKNFLLAARKFKAVHVATHGILNPEAPLFNFISFSQLQDTVDVGAFLYLQDLYYEYLGLALVSFSACRTARGQYVSGEGNMSMARGLAAAGVGSIVTTLWDVNADETRELTPIFYKYLRQWPKDVALMKAKQAFMSKTENNLDPSSWGSMVLIGNSKPMGLDGPGKRWWRWLFG